jgi:putative MATE family efflux protein
MKKSAALPGFYSSLFAIAVPVILQNLLQTFVSMLDTIMVGQLGSTEIAAVGLGNQIFFMLNMILFGISSGGSIFIAQFWGKKDVSGIRRTLGITLTFSCIVSVVFAFGALVFPQTLIGFYSEDPRVIELGAEYLRYVGISYPLLAVSFAYQLAFRATEHVNLPMVSTAASFAVNAAGNWLLIFGAGSVIPAMGVKGAAVATVFSRLVELGITVGWSYAHQYEPCGKLRELLSFNRAFTGRFFKIAFPVIINESLWGFGQTAENAVFAHAGTDAIASFNITGTISQLTWVFFIGVGNAAGIIIGKKIGEGNDDLARRYAGRFAWFMPAMAVIIGLLLYPLSLLLPYIFKVEPAIITESQRMLYVLMCFYPANAFNMCFIVGICRSGGDTIYAGFNDIFWMWSVAIPLGCVAAFIWKLHPYQVYICLQSEQLFKLAAGVIRVKSGKWLHNVTQ